jgi:O-antigen ligase
MLQGVLYPQGIINQTLQMVMIMWGGLAACKYLLSRSCNSKILNATSLLILMYIVYGGYIIFFGDGVTLYDKAAPSDYVYLQNSLASLLPIFLFYSFASRGYLTGERIARYIPLLILVFIVHFLKIMVKTRLQLGTEDITNNASYLFLSMLPILYFLNGKLLLQYLAFAISLAFILMGMKRGVYLLAFFSTIYFLFTSLLHQSRFKQIVIVLLFGSIAIFIINYMAELMDSNEFFIKRIEETLEGKTSGRDRLYSTIWSEIKTENNLLYFIFGRGANSTLKYAGNYAHNDWLETACNNGILGLCLLVYFFITLFSQISALRKAQYYVYHSFIVVVFLLFTKTMFSMSIQDIDIVLSMLLGYSACCIRQQTINLEK